jgi:hypothetical protein
VCVADHLVHSANDRDNTERNSMRRGAGFLASSHRRNVHRALSVQCSQRGVATTDGPGDGATPVSSADDDGADEGITPVRIHELRMPKVFASMEVGHLIKWECLLGDIVTRHNRIGAIGCGKARIDWYLDAGTAQGYMARQLVPDETKNIAAGRTVALLVEDEDHLASPLVEEMALRIEASYPKIAMFTGERSDAKEITDQGKNPGIFP